MAWIGLGKGRVQQTVRNVVCSEWGEGREVGAHNQQCDTLEVKLNGFILWALGNQDSLEGEEQLDQKEVSYRFKMPFW